MQDQSKTKERLVAELAKMRQKIGEWKASEAERKQAEKALRESEARFRALSAAAFDGIRFSEQGVVVDANQQFARIFGYEMSEIPGMPISKFVAPEDWELVQGRVLAGSEEPYEHRAVRKDGTTIFVEVRPG